MKKIPVSQVKLPGRRKKTEAGANHGRGARMDPEKYHQPAAYPPSVTWCRRCLAYPEYNAPRSTTAQVILARSLFQLHPPEQARTELAQARETLNHKFQTDLERGTGVQGFWFDWVFARSLLRAHSDTQ